MKSTSKKAKTPAKNNGVQSNVNGSLRIVSGKCVNSKWIASWLANNKQEYCQCPVECKIVVCLQRNGHAPYKYTVTKREYENLLRSTEVSNDR